MNFGDQRLPERLWEKISPCPMTGCWIWTGAVSGVPQIRWKISSGFKTIAVRRIIAELLASRPISCGIASDCSMCVNPSHYRLGDPGELGRRWAAEHPLTYCKHGHELAVVGTYVNSKHSKICRACHRNRMRVQTEKQRKRRLCAMSPVRRAEFERRSAVMREVYRTGKLSHLVVNELAVQS